MTFSADKAEDKMIENHTVSRFLVQNTYFSIQYFKKLI